MRKLVLSLFLTASLGCMAQYDEVIQQWRDSVRKATDAVIGGKIVVQGENRMPLFWTIYGKEPTDGRSMWISLHGGGGTPKQVNDGQWQNQKFLYPLRRVCMWHPEPPGMRGICGFRNP